MLRTVNRWPGRNARRSFAKCVPRYMSPMELGTATCITCIWRKSWQLQNESWFHTICVSTNLCQRYRVLVPLVISMISGSETLLCTDSDKRSCPGIEMLHFLSYVLNRAEQQDFVQTSLNDRTNSRTVRTPLARKFQQTFVLRNCFPRTLITDIGLHMYAK